MVIQKYCEKCKKYSELYLEMHFCPYCGYSMKFPVLKWVMWAVVGISIGALVIWLFGVGQ